MQIGSRWHVSPSGAPASKGTQRARHRMRSPVRQPAVAARGGCSVTGPLGRRAPRSPGCWSPNLRSQISAGPISADRKEHTLGGAHDRRTCNMSWRASPVCQVPPFWRTDSPDGAPIASSRKSLTARGHAICLRGKRPRGPGALKDACGPNTEMLRPRERPQAGDAGREVSERLALFPNPQLRMRSGWQPRSTMLGEPRRCGARRCAVTCRWPPTVIHRGGTVREARVTQRSQRGALGERFHADTPGVLLLLHLIHTWVARGVCGCFLPWVVAEERAEHKPDTVQASPRPHVSASRFLRAPGAGVRGRVSFGVET